MNASYREIIQRHCQPLEPIATGQAPRLAALSDIRAVLFDVYGTLLISASGDVGTLAAGDRAAAFCQALAAVGWPLAAPHAGVAELLLEQIQQAHEQAHAEGVQYPEIDMVAIWRATVQALMLCCQLPRAAAQLDMRRLAVHYEVRVNPTWPMPGLQSSLIRLRAADVRLGIVSNAQFYTPHLFPALMDASLEQLGFEPPLQFYSYRIGEAKPSAALYQRAQRELAGRGIAPRQVLYIGNDLLNDITPAQHVGFRTALFAGDARSLRLREGDPRIAGVVPDLVVTDLRQLGDCIAAPGEGTER